MKMHYRFVLVFVIICIVQPVFGQDTLRLSHQEFIAAVKNYHPLAFKYRLQNEIARAEIQKARGNFDPVIAGKNGSKTIDGIDYYTETNVGLGIPTWYGIELNGNYNYIDGQKINNSDTRGGLYQFGLTVPLAKNLLYDQRRALLDQAKIGLQMTEAEQIVLTNDLLLAADNAYWNWVKEYEIFLLQSKAVNINQDRLALTRKTYQYGETAAIDTTEALSQLQSFELEQKDAYLQFVKATQELSLFLWKENQQPYDILEGIIPTETLFSNAAYQDYAQLLVQLNGQPLSNHASVTYYLRKQEFLESERRFKFQSLLPKIDFTYNFFNKENYRSDFFPLFQNNYQYGLKLEIPIFLRQARGDYRIAKGKVQQNQLDTDYKRQEINTKLNTYKNEVLNYRSQIDVATQNIDNYERLVKAEEAKYSNGESSLFLINSRENKLIDAQEKILELRLKFIKGYNQLKWLNESFVGR
ncbi:MAG: TolC family protein [Pedobacter sp.]|nr:MAG: TolC family protein [Pedobacter sp.]